MPSLYYFAAWTDSACLIGCEHQHETVISAAHCISNAGGYVIAVQDGQLRELNEKEEREFQFVLSGRPAAKADLGVFVPKWSLN